MKKIAVGVDFSTESELAARQALEVARHLGAELVLVHARFYLELPPIGPASKSEAEAAFVAVRARVAGEIERSHEKLAELRARLSGQGPEVSQVLAEGIADEALCSAAGEVGADLLVVGTHGRTGLRWFFLGSVAERVVRLSPVDVLVARREVAGRGGFTNILVATDFSPASIRALDRALELVAPDGRVQIVHCSALWPVAMWGEGTAAYQVDLDGALEEEMRRQGNELVASRRRSGGPELGFRLLREPPAPAIVHLLETGAFDLAVVGSHGRKGFRRAILGSVAEVVVRRAPCSVLIARGQKT
jgi:nucleotide-binding universal stress UspA family protein